MFFFQSFSGRDDLQTTWPGCPEGFCERTIVEVKRDKSLIENLRYLQCWLHVKERIYSLGI